MDSREPLEDTQLTLTEHLDAALEHADDKSAIFHLRHAKQVALDLPTLVDAKADGSVDADEPADESAG